MWLACAMILHCCRLSNRLVHRVRTPGHVTPLTSTKDWRQYWQCRFQTHNLIMHNACTALLPSLEETYTECTRPTTLPVVHQKMHNLLFIPSTIVVSNDTWAMTHTPAATDVFRPSHETDVAFDPWLKNAPSQTFSLDFHTKTSRKRLKKPHFMVVLPLFGWAQDKAVGGGESSQAFSISTMTMKGSCSNHAKGSEHIFNLLRATNELQKVWNPPLSTWWSQRQKNPHVLPRRRQTKNSKDLRISSLWCFGLRACTHISPETWCVGHGRGCRDRAAKQHKKDIATEALSSQNCLAYIATLYWWKTGGQPDIALQSETNGPVIRRISQCTKITSQEHKYNRPKMSPPLSIFTHDVLLLFFNLTNTSF